MKSLQALGVLLLAATVPAVAQVPLSSVTPAPGSYVNFAEPIGRGGPFRSLSDAGRRTMHITMRSADGKADRLAVDSARDRMLTVLDAERLDPEALRRAMEDERAAAMAAKSRQQAAMIAGFQQLSLADRRAFVTEARAMRDEVKARLAGARRPRTGSLIPPPQ